MRTSQTFFISREQVEERRDTHVSSPTPQSRRTAVWWHQNILMAISKCSPCSTSKRLKTYAR